MDDRPLPDRITCRADVDALLATATNYEDKLPRDPLRKALDLGRVRALLASVGDPQRGPRTAHVAGSKGKGTVARMIASGLRHAGRGPVGLYTSPHLEDLAERIEIDGRPVGEGALARAAGRVLPHVRATRGTPEAPTFFEMFTAIAWLAFREAGCRVVVLETGLGGRLDATNVCEPAVTVITRIEREHVRLLGDTIEAIAAEKAGILKAGVDVVTYASEPALGVIRRRAAEVGAPLHVVDASAVPAGLALPGAHHRPNAAAAVAALGVLGVDADTAWAGVGRAALPGILETVDPGPPPVVVDGAHTPASAAATRAAAAARWPGRPLVLVVAILDEKDAPGVLRALAADARAIVTTRVASPRALPAKELAALVAEATPLAAEPIGDPAAAVERARVLAGPGGLVLCAGSVYLAGAVRTLVRRSPPRGSPGS